jgi:hypothetical protein
VNKLTFAKSILFGRDKAVEPNKNEIEGEVFSIDVNVNECEDDSDKDDYIINRMSISNIGVQHAANSHNPVRSKDSMSVLIPQVAISSQEHNMQENAL